MTDRPRFGAGCVSRVSHRAESCPRLPHCLAAFAARRSRPESFVSDVLDFGSCHGRTIGLFRLGM